jgi:hypothetical protein
VREMSNLERSISQHVASIGQLSKGRYGQQRSLDA